MMQEIGAMDPYKTQLLGICSQSSSWISGTREIANRMLEKMVEFIEEKVIYEPNGSKTGCSYCPICGCNFPSNSESQHVRGKRHQKTLESRYIDKTTRQKLIAYLNPIVIREKIDEAERVFLVRFFYDSISTLGVYHDPWINELKALCADIEHGAFKKSSPSMMIDRFMLKQKVILKKEKMALVLLAFIKSEVTCNEMILMSDIRASGKAWKRTMNELLITKGGVLMNRIAGFVSV